ncbi:MAG: hypothetical protein WD872_01740, partial [Pirellulaceae bacterium]
MRPDLRALGGVQQPLEQRAKNVGLDAAPILVGSFGQMLDFFGPQVDHLGIGEQAAVEMQDFLQGKSAAVGHCRKQFLEELAKLRGDVLRLLERAAEDAVGEQLNVLGEHREHQLHQKMGDIVRRHAALAHGVGHQTELFAHQAGDAAAGDAGPQGVGLGEQPAKNLQVVRLGQARQVEFIDPLGGAGKVGVDFEAVEVADDQQRRVVERF